MRNCIQILSLSDTPIIDKVIGTANHLITRITCPNETVRHVANVDEWDDILTRANDKSLTRCNQRDKATKAGRIAWAIDPTGADNYHGRAIISHQVGKQFLACNLRATIWVVLSVKGIVLGHNTMQVMPVDGDRTRMNNALYTCIH